MNEKKVDLSNNIISNGANKTTEKFRIYRKGGIIEDSLKETESEEEEYDDDDDGFLINPESKFFFFMMQLF